MTMGRSVRLGLAVACLGLAVAPGTRAAAAEPPVADFAKLKDAAGEDLATSEGMAYAKHNQKALQDAISAAFGKCSDQIPAGKSAAFEFVVGIGADGTPQDVVVRTEDPFGTCFAKAFPATNIGKPPKQPFHVYVYMGAGK